MGILDWFRRTGMRGSDNSAGDETSAPAIALRISSGEAFTVHMGINRYADIYQACYEILMEQHGARAPALGAWTEATMSCAGCGRAFPNSFKLHLTNPGMLGDRLPRSDCPGCGSRVARIAYSPPTA